MQLGNGRQEREKENEDILPGIHGETQTENAALYLRK